MLLVEGNPMTLEHEGDNHFSSISTVTTQTARPDRPRRNVILTGAVLCVVALIAVGLIPRLFLNRDLRKEASQQAATAANVFVAITQASPSSVAVQLSGTMSPITEAPVLARTDGYLKKRLVDIGDRVHTGQILGVIEAPDLDQQVQQARSLYQQSKSTLEQSQAALDQAKANAGIAGITAERWAALVKRGAVSRQANDNYQFAYNAQVAAVGVATASVAAANNSVGANAANLDHYRELQSFEVVRAPFDGVITQRNVDDGALISATNTLLFRVAKNNVLRTYIDVPQINAPSIRVGDTADLSFVQHPGQVFHGKVTRTADSLNLNTRTLLTEVDIDNKDGLLLPGMYATVTFHVPRAVAAIMIPSEALVFRSNGTTVAVVDDHHIVTFRQVVVGHDYGASIEIISGLKAGEAIVVNPNDTTFEGARVNPVVVKQPAGSLSPAATSAPASSNTQSNTQHK
jgi:RND family efflux transporter MFP subunit